MTQAEALKALLAKVEAGEGKENDGILYTIFKDNWTHAWDVINLGSLDAAKALHETVLPGWRVTHAWGLTGDRTCKFNLTKNSDPVEYTVGQDENPARAWLKAILKAKIAETQPAQDKP